MATKYNDIIELRAGKGAYNIEHENMGEWRSFIPNEQFNDVLTTVIKSVQGNDVDNHKSFWINGTYGTGKSHAVAVISHLLSDDVEDIREWIEDEYGGDKFDHLRMKIKNLRKSKRLLTVKLSGLNAMTQSSDLVLILQKAVGNILQNVRGGGGDLVTKTDFETYIEHIKTNPEIWDHLIKTNSQLSSIVVDCETLIKNLKDDDLKTFHCVTDALRQARLDVIMDSNNIKQWLLEVQNKIREIEMYDGLLIVWDEFTDVMTDAIGLPVLKMLQDILEAFMDTSNDIYFFLISHPSAFNRMGSEQMKQTDGRYHRMKYNMESVSAFKIMSRKFRITNRKQYTQICQRFYQSNQNLLDVFTQSSNKPQSTKSDLQNLFPLHPGTANLATHYATVVGSSSRSVFEFLGQNDAIREFLNNEDYYSNRDTITADYLWDYVLKIFQDDIQNYGPVTERWNSYEKQVESKGNEYFAIFKVILLLNAFNNVSGANNNGLITPSEENIQLLFQGTRYSDRVSIVLDWFNSQAIIQRTPGELFSVQFSALPSGEIEQKKNEMRNVHFKITSKIIDFASDETKRIVEKRFMPQVIRPHEYKFYSDVENDSQLRNQIKKGRKDTKSSYYFFALLVSRNNDEYAKIKTFAERCAVDQEDKDLENIIFVVIDAVLGEDNYERFIEYQANYACASNHGFQDQTVVHRNHSIGMVKEWLEAMLRANATIYIKGQEERPIQMSRFSGTINNEITKIIYSYGPDAHEALKQKVAFTFWKIQNSKEIVRKFLISKTKSDLLEGLTTQMRPIQHLLHDCLDENLQWKTDTPENHPFKTLCDKVDEIIKDADKTLSFNFYKKFYQLTEPPFGLYSNFAAMGMMAFALRPYVNKIFDLQGKPRDENALVDDIVSLFKAWETDKSNVKLEFKFQTPEEGKLCKSLISLFGLNGKNNQYRDVTSLKDARFAILADFLKEKETPLWALKYAPETQLIRITEPIKQLIHNIVKICATRELRDLSLINETLQLIDELSFDIKNILTFENVFTDGFNAFLRQIEIVNVQQTEIEEVKRYIHQRLESSVGYWTEEEVEKSVKDWRLLKQQQSQQQKQQSSFPQTETDMPNKSVKDTDSSTIQITDTPQRNEIISDKRSKAKNRIAMIENVDIAKTILNKLCERNEEWIFDIINE